LAEFKESKKFNAFEASEGLNGVEALEFIRRGATWGTGDTRGHVGRDTGEHRGARGALGRARRGGGKGTVWVTGMGTGSGTGVHGTIYVERDAYACERRHQQAFALDPVQGTVHYDGLMERFIT